MTRQPLITACFAAYLLATTAPALCGELVGEPPRGDTAADLDRHAEVVIFKGACDASGAVPLGDRLFMVADDEDNILRLYDAHQGGQPIATFDLTEKLKRKLISGELEIPEDANFNKELDLEAATKIGNTSFWLTSHGINAKGKRKAERFQFLALQHDEQLDQLEWLGQPYTTLIDDLIQHPPYRHYHLHKAANNAAESAYGINLEGMTARRSGGVYIGFRNPVPQGQALLITLENPLEVALGKPPAFGPSHTLDLHGLGIRGLSATPQGYLIAAGDRGAGENSAIFFWRDDTQAAVHLDYDLPGDFNTEAFFTPKAAHKFMALSDDGTRHQRGVECKKLKDDQHKQFRGAWLKHVNLIR